ncbi:GNAT family N-acetyltransferase [Candidatus Fermentibacteria bacterium]|nr:GNAT family N-acetyltransferase [Candidatus Fermentibacteria bacterium]
MSDYTSRILQRRDLVHFLSGQLLGFALDDYFTGAYLGAFDERDRPVGFIFTGHREDMSERLIGVPHVVDEMAPDPEAEEFLVREALKQARSEVPVVLAAVYSDQSPQERERLQRIYGDLGMAYLRDSTRMYRELSDLPQNPELDLAGLDDLGTDTFATVAQNAARCSEWEDIEFDQYLEVWRSSPRFDPELFGVSTQDEQPTGVVLARLDRLDPTEGGFYFLGVLPEFRGQGLGKSLLIKGLHLLRDKGAERTRQILPAGEGPGMRLLVSVGYRMVEWARYFKYSTEEGG